jgi:hypothetical protein
MDDPDPDRTADSVRFVDGEPLDMTRHDVIHSDHNNLEPLRRQPGEGPAVRSEGNQILLEARADTSGLIPST